MNTYKVCFTTCTKIKIFNLSITIFNEKMKFSFRSTIRHIQGNRTQPALLLVEKHKRRQSCSSQRQFQDQCCPSTGAMAFPSLKMHFSLLSGQWQTPLASNWCSPKIQPLGSASPSTARYRRVGSHCLGTKSSVNPLTPEKLHIKFIASYAPRFYAKIASISYFLIKTHKAILLFAWSFDIKQKLLCTVIGNKLI